MKSEYQKRIILLFGLLFILFVFYTCATSPFHPTIQRGLSLLLVIPIAILLFPSSKKMRFLDYLLLLTAIPVIYLIINWKQLAYRALFEPTFIEYLFGFIVIFGVIELTRRVIGWPLSLITLIAILYARFGGLLPSPFTHRGYSVARLMANQYLTHEGIFSSILGITSTIVAPFVLLGAIATYTGVTELFLDMAVKFSGRTRGGPAKMAVAASAFFGTISGSAITNVVTTGSITIPLMKRTGYDSTFAGAVESAASTGGQLIPPVMGVAAFLMAHITGIPYLTIMIAAIIPAFLYMLALFLCVDLEARRLSLKPFILEDGIANKTNIKIVSYKNLFMRIYLLIPFVVLIYYLMKMYSPGKSALYATITMLILSFIKKETRLNYSKIKNIIIFFAKGMTTVVFACAAAGMVVGALNLTGSTLRLTYSFVEIAAGNQFLLLFLIAILCIILGMGLPTPAAYAVAASFAAPALTTVGIETLPAHLFVFYFACISAITPPVASAAFGASSISGASPIRTAVTACKLALAGFLVPFMFVYGHGLLIGQAPIWLSIRSGLTSILGIFLLAISVIGYHLNRPINIVERILYFLASILLISQNRTTDISGIFIVILLFIYNYYVLRSKSKRPDYT